jgi:hypothetical protein
LLPIPLKIKTDLPACSGVEGVPADGLWLDLLGELISPSNARLTDAFACATVERKNISLLILRRNFRPAFQ